MRGGVLRAASAALLALCLVALALPLQASAAGAGATGSIEVVVLDGGAPVSHAVVLLPGIGSGYTDANGRISFSGLAYGQYRVSVATAQAKGGNGAVTLDQAHPTGTITVTLSSTWPVPAVGLNGPGAPACGACQPPPTPPACGACQPPHLTTGAIAGRICTPAAPGAQISATGPNGETASAWVAADSAPGLYRSYSLANLAPGLWKLVLKIGGQAVASTQVTVKAGETASASDFSLACTGSGGSPVGAYLGGGALVLAGFGLIGRRLVRRV